MIRYQLVSEAISKVSITALTSRLALLIRPQIVMCSSVACILKFPDRRHLALKAGAGMNRLFITA